jgi:acetyl-CoA carboxylase beta subunit
MYKPISQTKKLITIVNSADTRVTKKIFSKSQFLKSLQSNKSIQTLYDMDDITDLTNEAIQASDTIGDGKIKNHNDLIQHAEKCFNKNESLTILYLEEGAAIIIIVDTLNLNDYEDCE